MRLLLDECVDERLRHFFSAHDCQTARFANMAGLKNGELLAAAEKPYLMQSSRLIKGSRFSKDSLVAPLHCSSCKLVRIC